MRVTETIDSQDAVARYDSFLAVTKQHGRSVDSLLRRRGSKALAFGWYGGKYSHLDWLLPLLPEAHHYCEPFAGSAAVMAGD